MADGSNVPLRDVRKGDAVFGTRTIDGQRRREPTRVLAHWRTTKPAHEIVLGNGTTLIAA